MPPPSPATLHLVTRPVPGGFRALVQRVARCLEAGVRIVQYRDKEASVRDQVARARALARLAREHGALLIVNDRLDVALAAGAGGVHLGWDDLPWDWARRAAPPPFLLGCTAATPERVRLARACGADYAGAGPAAPSATKRDTGPVLSPADFAALAAEASRTPPRPLPLIAIGGVTADRVPELIAAGARGVAVSEAVLGADDPAAAARALLAALVHAREDAGNGQS